jgi:hypothetical protein
MFLTFSGYRPVVLACLMFCQGVALHVRAESNDLGEGFVDHGVPARISQHRGIVATSDQAGKDIVLAWLFDHRGGYGLLQVDAESGESHLFSMPFPVGSDCPFASVLSSRNRFYTLFDSHFCEFDAAKGAFTFHHKTSPRSAMSMTEDDRGVIWAATYPDCGVVAFDPQSRAFRDFGSVHDENWKQYPRSIAADEEGILYIGIGFTRGQFLSLDPATGKTHALLEDAQRQHATAQVWRGMDGKVYGSQNQTWYRLSDQQAHRLDGKPDVQPKPIITDTQHLIHRRFPRGRRLVKLDLVNRSLTTENPATGQRRSVDFAYPSEGPHIMGVATSPDGRIFGGTAFPMRFFAYDPREDRWTSRHCYGQWNTLAVQGERAYIGAYAGGMLLRWKPSQAWVPTRKNQTRCNPQLLTTVTPDIHRPHDLLAHPDGRTVILAGTPAYGLTGGGLLFWDSSRQQAHVVKHGQILPYHSTFSLLDLPDGKLLGGTTRTAGSGGEIKAPQAELYIMDMQTRRVEWHAPIIPRVQAFSDLCHGPDGRVYGIADWRLFFVFDPVQRKVLHKSYLDSAWTSTARQQGARIFVRDDKANVYLLTYAGIVQVDPETFELKLVAPSQVKASTGGTCLDGRIYFASGSHLYSWGL